MKKLHTPEPWGISPDVSTHIWNEGGDTQIAACNLDNVSAIANARRIVACVNALEGWETERLEKSNALGPLTKRIYEAEEAIEKAGFDGESCGYSVAVGITKLTAQRDELLAALKEVAISFCFKDVKLEQVSKIVFDAINKYEHPHA